MGTHDTTWVAKAVKALEPFQPASRDEAELLLSMWRHRQQLTDKERSLVLDVYSTAPRQ